MRRVELIQGETLMKTQAFFSGPAPPDSFITRLTPFLPVLWKSNLPCASIPPHFVYQFIRGKARAERPGSALPHIHIFYTWDLCGDTWTLLAALCAVVPAHTMLLWCLGGTIRHANSTHALCGQKCMVRPVNY